MKFSELKVNEKIIQATKDMEFENMTEIQEQANDQELTGTIQSIRPSYRL